jgi:SsrA-binding protein
MKIISKNKRAQLDYEIESEFEAWIVLHGFEVKSIRLWQVNIWPAIVKILWNEAFITNMDIPLYYKTSPILAPNYDPKWTRKLLLKKKRSQK